MTSSQQGRQQESPTVSGTQFQDVGLEQLRQRVHAFAAERDWQQYHTPRNLLLALTGEVITCASCDGQQHIAFYHFSEAGSYSSYSMAMYAETYMAVWHEAAHW